jgi:hypothetical protein
VFETTDYSEYVPMKRTNVDFNNMNDTHKKQDHLYSDILGGSQPVRSPAPKKTDDLKSSRPQSDMKSVRKDATPATHKGKKQDNLRSALDTHDYEAGQFKA